MDILAIHVLNFLNIIGTNLGYYMIIICNLWEIPFWIENSDFLINNFNYILSTDPYRKCPIRESWPRNLWEKPLLD